MIVIKKRQFQIQIASEHRVCSLLYGLAQCLLNAVDVYMVAATALKQLHEKKNSQRLKMRYGLACHLVRIVLMKEKS